MELSPGVQQSFQIARSFTENTKRINAIAFSPKGDRLATTADDDNINVYNCENGTHSKPMPSKKYGCDLITYTHADNNVLYASTKVDNKVMQLSLHDQKYLRYYVAHKAKITSIRMHPISDMFMTCSKDSTIRMWDVNADKCFGQIPTSEYSAVDYDSGGLVFGIGYGGSTIKLYDARSYEKGPFDQKTLPDTPPQEEILDLKFSGDGQHVVVLTSQGVAHVLDAYNLETKHRLGRVAQDASMIVNICFSPCGQYLYGGLPEGRVVVWNVQTGMTVAELGGHSDQVNAVAFNPKKMMFASACTSLSMWLPSL